MFVQFWVAAPVGLPHQRYGSLYSPPPQLSFAMSSPIPLLCSIACADAHALDQLAQSPAVGLHLMRTLAVGTTATTPAAHQSHTAFRMHAAKARWWPDGAHKPGPGVRRLAGEIHVRKGSKPSSLFPRLSVYVRPSLCIRGAPLTPRGSTTSCSSRPRRRASRPSRSTRARRC
jgi:hypothetical protein